jgi:hypothetical protein
MVDTLKLHIYPSDELTIEQITFYNEFIAKQKTLKSEAMSQKAELNEDRFVETKIDNFDFHVMARTVKSFSVLLQNNDLSLAFKQITDKSNNPCIKIEFRSEYLARLGYVQCINITQGMLRQILPDFKIKVSELHLATDIQGYDFTAMDKDRMSFRNRGLQDFTSVDNTLFGSGLKKTGFSFGKDAFMLRIYDKTHQIQQNKKAGYVVPLRWELNDNYIEDEKVWRIEFQFRRDYLKTLVGVDGILDGFEIVLNAIPDLWKHATQRFVHYNLSKQQCIDIYTNETKDRNNNTIPLTRDTIKMRKIRAGISPLWGHISTFNNHQSTHNITKFKETKKPEAQYVVNAWKGLISTSLKLNRGDFNKHDIKDILITANEEDLIKKGFSILDSARLKTAKYMQSLQTQYYKNGEIIDGFEEYQSDLHNNLLDTLNNITNLDYRDNFLNELEKIGTIQDIDLHKEFKRDLF